MEVSNLPLHFEYVMHSGCSIPREEQIVLTWSLKEIQQLNHFEEIYFWGMLYGEKCDYYICYGITKDYMKGRIYFYSLNREEWVILPKPIPELESKVLICTSLLSGDPSYQTEVYDDEPKDESKDDIEEEPTHDIDEAAFNILDIPGEMGTKFDEEETSEKDPNEVNENMLKEEDRLSSMVKLITEECAVVPRGAFIKQLNGKVIKDDRYRGLEPEEALEFRSYFHLRQPRSKYNENLIRRTDSDFAIDIFDTIDDDVPNRKTWTIRNTDDDMVIIKNLTWPGMTFYHKVNTDIFGYIYVGYGMRNMDLPFML